MAYGKTQQIKKSFAGMTVSLASPESILERSYGEVLKPETINYRSFKPEKDGLFCEKIFGPVKDWECHCGKYKRIRYKGIICDRCGVEVTQKKVRRERMGHITLSVPVVHIWYFKTLPNKIGHLLGLKSKDLEKIVYYENYVVIQPGSASKLGIEKDQLLSEDEYFDILYQIREDNNRLDDEDPEKFVAKIGGEAVEMMLKRLDLPTLSSALRFQVKTETSQQRKQEALKRLAVVEAFREASKKMENRPEWMVMRVIPVIPSERTALQTLTDRILEICGAVSARDMTIEASCPRRPVPSGIARVEAEPDALDSCAGDFRLQLIRCVEPDQHLLGVTAEPCDLSDHPLLGATGPTEGVDDVEDSHRDRPGRATFPA